MKCAECEQTVDEQALELIQNDEAATFCSYECLIAYSVRRVRQLVQKRGARLLANYCSPRQSRSIRPRATHRHLPL